MLEIFILSKETLQLNGRLNLLLISQNFNFSDNFESIKKIKRDVYQKFKKMSLTFVEMVLMSLL